MPPKPRYLRNGGLSRINKITRFSHRHSGEGRNPPRGRSAQPRPPYSHPNPPPSPSHPPRRRGQGGGYPPAPPSRPHRSLTFVLSHSVTPAPFTPEDLFVIPAPPESPNSHSRESGNLELGVQPHPVTPSLVIPTSLRESDTPHSGESRNPSHHAIPHPITAPRPPPPCHSTPPPPLSFRAQRGI